MARAASCRCATVAIAINSACGLSGGVGINGGAGTIMSAAPFGGIRRSGLGREFGPAGLDEFTYTKTITFRAA